MRHRAPDLSGLSLSTGALTKYLDALPLSAEDRYKLFEGNARKVYPRLEKTDLAKKLKETAKS